MVEPRRILDAIRAAITAAEPDGRYALEGATFEPRWLVSPDDLDQLSARDLLAIVSLGGPVVQGEALIYPVQVAILTATYRGERTSYLSSLPLTAQERYHGAALHMLEVLSNVSIPGCAPAPIGYEPPVYSDPPDYLTGAVFLTLVAT